VRDGPCLAVPAPASTRTGPRSAVATARCSGSSPSSRRSASVTVAGSLLRRARPWSYAAPTTDTPGGIAVDTRGVSPATPLPRKALSMAAQFTMSPPVVRLLPPVEVTARPRRHRVRGRGTRGSSPRQRTWWSGSTPATRRFPTLVLSPTAPRDNPSLAQVKRNSRPEAEAHLTNFRADAVRTRSLSTSARSTAVQAFASRHSPPGRAGRRG
jgi:hypothetical protein